MLLLGFGVILGVSAAWNDGPSPPGVIPQPVKTVIWSGIGFAVLAVAASVDYHWLRTFAVPIYLSTLGLLVLNLLAGNEELGRHPCLNQRPKLMWAPIRHRNLSKCQREAEKQRDRKAGKE